MAAAIYTRTGDGGQTRLRDGTRVFKDDLQVAVCGCVDELQSHLGLARALSQHHEVTNVLLEVQRDLFKAGSELALTSKGLMELKASERLGSEDVARLERHIDCITARYGLPRRFVVAGAGADSAAVHVARAVCRRCERSIVALHRKNPFYETMLMYFNRLSDLLFVLAWALEVHTIVVRALQSLVSHWDEDRS
ncbi:cob(I)yrinic acid a,c-diamide adenosyltransferase [Desulfosoma sp.]